VTLMIDTHQKN